MNVNHEMIAGQILADVDRERRPLAYARHAPAAAIPPEIREPAVAAERQRIAAILGHPLAATHTRIVRHLAFETAVSAAEAATILATIGESSAAPTQVRTGVASLDVEAIFAKRRADVDTFNRSHGTGRAPEEAAADELPATSRLSTIDEIYARRRRDAERAGGGRA